MIRNQKNNIWKCFLRKYILYCLGMAVILFSCKLENNQNTIIHLVPNNYEGPLVESLQKGGKSLKHRGDTIFISYDERGIAIYRDTIVHFSGIEEKYYYIKDGERSKNQLLVKDEEIYHGMCKGIPFYSVIVRHKDLDTSFSEEQKELVKKYICNK